MPLLWPSNRFAVALCMAAAITGAANLCSGAVVLVDTPDVKIRDAGTPSIEAVGKEPTVAADPDNWCIVLVSTIANSSATGWFSTDGGLTWSGNNEPVNPPAGGGGDPSVVISRGPPTRYFIQSIAADLGQQLVKVDTPGNPWEFVSFPTGEFKSSDKGFLTVDNTPSSPGYPFLYSLWYRVNDGLAFRRSTNRGATWTPDPPIELQPSGVAWGGALGVAIATQTLGHVYAAWPSYAQISLGPQSLRFRRSEDRGQSFLPLTGSVQITDYLGGSFGFRTDIGLHTGGNANSIPTMATDDLGNIYVAWCQRRRPGDGTGLDTQIYVSKSTDNGDTWPTPTSMTATPVISNQWLPSIAWDNDAKALVVVYLDDRDDPNSVRTYLGVSYDRGATFTDLKISDVAGTGDIHIGDYIGVAAVGGVAHPAWCDDREAGVVKTFVSPILIGGIDTATVAHSVSHSCLSPGNPRLRLQVDWGTLADMDGIDELAVTPPGQSPIVVTVQSTSKTHQLVVYAPCVNGTWTYTVKSRKGTLVSTATGTIQEVTCISCPPLCSPSPCEFD